MAIDTLTLALNGSLRLDLFAKAMANFDALVQALSREIARPASIQWALEGIEGTVEERHVSSALVTSVGESRDVESVERVVRAYGHVGKSLEQGLAIPYSAKVSVPAKKIVGVLNGAVTSIRFETPEDDATIRSGVAPDQRMPNLVTYGAIEGRVQALSQRRGLRFTLYDQEFDRAVSCYLSEGQEELMRNAWGNRAIVEGRVTRDAVTGRPLAIRRITDVELVDDRAGGFGAARGAVRVSSAMPLPEVLVRRLRDA